MSDPVGANNPARVFTAAPPFAKALLAYLGEDITLPDDSVIQAIVHDSEKTEGGDMTGNVFSEVLYARIPTGNLGTLVAQQVVTYDGEAHYVPTLQRTGKGWTVFTLERQ